VFSRGFEVDQLKFTKRAPVSVDTGAPLFNLDYGNLLIKQQ